MDAYKCLGVHPDASAEEIKRAYREQVFRHHPDTNPKGGAAAHACFQELQEAWHILRDEGKRAQYDRMRAAGFGAANVEEAAAASATPWGQPSIRSEHSDQYFEEWWKKMSEEFQDYEEQQFAQQHTNAERMAKAAAWEWEKEEAQLNKGRAQRLKWRTEDVCMQQHATTLRRFWQTHHGITPGDVLFMGVFLAGAAGITLAWQSHIQEARQRQQLQSQQQQGQRLPPAAAVASMAAAAAAQSS